MRVKTIQIDGLFGMFNHVIPLNTDQRITILHGPNGVGKTTVLRLITDLFSKRFYAVRTINYRSLRVEFLPPDPPLTIFSEAEQESGPSRKVRIVSKIKGRKVEYELATSKEFKQLARIVPRAAIDEFVPSLERVSPDLWLDESTGEVLDLDQVWFRYGDSLPFARRARCRSPRLPLPLMA
jgi:predicted ATP-binding protein involved in virulence